MRPFDYAAPARLEDAVGLLAKTPGARVIAGGTHLLLEPSRSRLAAPVLVDLRKVAGLAGIQAEGGGLRIGAMTTLAALAADGAVRQACAAVSEAAGLVGDPQVRNRATLGGSLAIGEPGADLPAALLAADACVQVVGAGGLRTEPLSAVLGTLAPGDVIASVLVPAAAPRTGSAYEKIRHPATLYALCGVAASVTLAADGTVAACRVAVTGATAPTRAAKVEAAVTGARPTADVLASACAGATAGAALYGDAAGSAEYRAHLATVLAARAIARAAARAGAA